MARLFDSRGILGGKMADFPENPRGRVLGGIFKKCLKRSKTNLMMFKMVFRSFQNFRFFSKLKISKIFKKKWRFSPEYTYF